MSPAIAANRHNRVHLAHLVRAISELRDSLREVDEWLSTSLARVGVRVVVVVAVLVPVLVELRLSLVLLVPLKLLLVLLLPRRAGLSLVVVHVEDALVRARQPDLLDAAPLAAPALDESSHEVAVQRVPVEVPAKGAVRARSLGALPVPLCHGPLPYALGLRLLLDIVVLRSRLAFWLVVVVVVGDDVVRAARRVLVIVAVLRLPPSLSSPWPACSLLGCECVLSG